MRLIKTATFKVAVNERGDEASLKMAILMPGRLDTKDYVNFTAHADPLAREGFYVIAIDMPGTWDSPGDISKYTTTTYLQVINELIEHFGARPTLLLGHSRGGATAMLASRNEAVVGLVLVNAAYGNPSPPDPTRIENNTLVEYRDLPPGNTRTKEQKQFDLPLAYFEDGPNHDPLAALKIFQGPKLIVHATDDEFEPFNKIEQVYNELVDPKMFLKLKSTHDYRLFPKTIKAVNEKLVEFVQTYFNR